MQAQMDLHESSERERSEPCSVARANPFTEEEEHTARKRQRIANGTSRRSHSTDTAKDLDSTNHNSSSPPEANGKPTTPQTPPNMSSQPVPEPTSSRVTINLRTNRSQRAPSSSPPSPSLAQGSGTGTRRSIESESDALSTIGPMKTPSSSPSDSGSPLVELVSAEEDDLELDDRDPINFIGDDENSESDLMESFPLCQRDASLAQTIGRISNILQFEEIDDRELFAELRDWIDRFLKYARDPTTFYDLYNRYRDLWIKFPNMIWALHHRSRFFGQFLQRSRDGRQCLTDLLAQFARLAGRFVHMDIWILEQHAKHPDSDPPPYLTSYPYMQAYRFLLQKEEGSHIGKNLETHYNWDWDVDVALFADHFRAEGGTLANLTKFVVGQSRFIENSPKLAEQFTEPCRIAAIIVGSPVPRYRDAPAAYETKLAQGYKFFMTMSDCLNLIIEKYVTNITPEATAHHLTSLTDIYQHILSSNYEQVRGLLEQFCAIPENKQIPRKACPKAIAFTWKYGILFKLITSAQMQLRVVGVTTMCTDLLNFYNNDKGVDAPDTPLLLYFAKLVLRTQLVDYLVGMSSHPELIHESYNILGFLLVTHTYKEVHTDTIWQTVMTSQDPRVVGAILRMTIRSVHLFELQQMFHLCQKVGEVPVTAFTPAMRDFCTKLLEALVQKCNSEGANIRPPPYDLCVRLIRESSIRRNDAPMGYPDIQAFALQRLLYLLQVGPSADSRNTIYESCIKDIASRSRTASGSICIISAFLRRFAGDLRVLTTEHGLTLLMIKELELTNTGGNRNHLVANQGMVSCLEIIAMIINNEPSTISAELGQRLWDVLVGSDAKTVIDRNTSWQILNEAARKSPLNNNFMVSCFQDYLPTLPPHCFTSGSLDFTKEAVQIWMDSVSIGFVEEDRKFESQAMEQLWRMILTAPPNTIDTAAIKALVEIYIDSELILSLPRPKSRSIHLALVERCLEQLKSAATKLKDYSGASSVGFSEGMVIVASEGEFQKQEDIFARSLAVLREFLKAHQSKPQFAAPKSRSRVLTASTNIEGEPLVLKYQSFDGNNNTEIKSLTLSKESTVASFLASLQEATGFKHYKIYCDGKQFDPDEVEVCQSLGELNLKGLVLVQRREDADSSLSQPGGSRTSLEVEIMKHIDDLWSYLGMHDRVAQEIHYFLVQFPVYPRLLEEIESELTSYSEIFPAAHPFKSLYAIHVLRETVSSSSRLEDFAGPNITRAISLIVAALSDNEVPAYCMTDDLRDCLAMSFVGCLVQLLREPVLPTSLEVLLDKPLFEKLLRLLKDAKSVTGSNNTIHLTVRSFEAMLESSLHSPIFWNLFISHLGTTGLLRDLLLGDPRVVIRKSVLKHIISRCSFTPSLARVSAMEITVALWPITSALVPEAVLRPLQCDETFGLALLLFRKIGENTIELGSLGTLVSQWGSLLLGYQSGEQIDCPESIDTVAQGLACLLQATTMLAKASQQKLLCGSVGTRIFRKRLFPELSKDEDLAINGIMPRLPLLHAPTREKLSETVFLLTKDDATEYKKILESLVDLVPYSEIDDDPYCFDLPHGFDRTKAVRSVTGYVGLRNLSNTCYLNSLFTQLFMNIPFRRFMLSLNISDGSNQQKLLSETQSLFSNMQNSLSRFVDPGNLASSIQTYDNSNIDVSIQMDVDEFYNLLFDRWEGQIPSPDGKRLFKSYYGGQLVQQVKSKECDHISEREESFSAIQCDIKGKTCLEESLRAYVEGEIMEGDNKYKCSTCDRHVDAVKRACLKDIPDNLIFHLKRFDFNLRTLQRSKINDHFSFPKSIDMRPYKVDHVMENPEGTPADIFELVGVLVHSGTAESGHYYSYIRERPSNSNKQPWVEFNDEIVSQWDPSGMEACCYGGTDTRPLNGDIGYDKNYSAYMLFYQRSSAVVAQQQKLELEKLSSPVRLDIPANLGTHIAMENELLLRKYCLYDPSHTFLVSRILTNMKNINGGRCSASHDLEKSVLRAALDHMDQVVARAKDVPQFSMFLNIVNKTCQACAECSRDFIEWLCDCPDALRCLLLRNPDSGVRSEIASLILAALKKVKADASYAYGLDEDENADDMDESDQPQVIHRFADGMSKLYEYFHSSSRAWPEYFGLLSDIVRLGREEAAIFLDRGFLRKTIEIISADPLLPLGPQYSRMYNIISKRLATRPVSYEAIIGLLGKLLQICDSSMDPIADNGMRLRNAMTGHPIPFTNAERHLLVQHWTRTDSHILTEKLLRIHQNEYATRDIIIYLLEWQQNIDFNICQAILFGIRNGPSTPLSGPFLKAALIYCEYTEVEGAISAMIQEIAKVANSIDNAEGKEFLQFFKDVTDITGNKSNTPKDDLICSIIESANQWGPGLLTSYDASVRSSTESFIHDLIIRHGPDVDFGLDEDDKKARTIVVAAQALGLACLDFIQETYIRQRIAAVRATLMNIQVVIEGCGNFFLDEDRDDHRFFERKASVLAALKKCMVEEADEETSDWGASDEEYPSSEMNEDLNGVESNI